MVAARRAAAVVARGAAWVEPLPSALPSSPVVPAPTQPTGDPWRSVLRQTSEDALAPVGGSAPVVRSVRDADLGRIAWLHRSELGHGLYPLLGERFLRHYHGAILASPHAASAAIGPVGSPDGFVVTLLDPIGHRRWLRGRVAVTLAVNGCIALATHPRALLLFLRTRVGRYVRAALPSRRSDAAAAGSSAPPAVLLHVAVDPDARGRGLGQTLVADCLAAAGTACRDRVRLVTAHGSPAERFYEQLGWTRVGVRPGRDGSLVTEFGHATDHRAVG